MITIQLNRQERERAIKLARESLSLADNKGIRESLGQAIATLATDSHCVTMPASQWHLIQCVMDEGLRNKIRTHLDTAAVQRMTTVTLRLTRQERDRVLELTNDNLPYGDLSEQAELGRIIATVTIATVYDPPGQASVTLSLSQWGEIQEFMDEHDQDEVAAGLLNKINRVLSQISTAGGVE